VADQFKNIKQDLTLTELSFVDGIGVPNELPLSLIVWDNSTELIHDKYKPIANVTVNEVGRYLMAIGTNLGGSIIGRDTVIREQNGVNISVDSIRLSNGLLVERTSPAMDLLEPLVMSMDFVENGISKKGGRKRRDTFMGPRGDHRGTHIWSSAHPSFSKEQHQKFLDNAKAYAETLGDIKHLSYVDSNAGVMFETLSNNFRSLYRLNCEVRQSQANFLTHLLELFPNLAKRFVATQGETMSQHGELVVINKCRKVENFKINWSRRIKGRCFGNFPIEIDNKTLYLNLITREASTKMHLIDCRDIPSRTFIKVTNRTYVSIDQHGTFDNHTVEFNDRRFMSTPRFKDSRLDRFLEQRGYLHPASLLQLMEQGSSAISDLNRIHNMTGSVTHGILTEIGSIFGSIGAAGGSIIGSLGSVLGNLFGDVASGSSEIVDSVAGGASEIIESSGTALADAFGGLVPTIGTLGACGLAIVALCLGVRANYLLIGIINERKIPKSNNFNLQNLL
jgi:hypothetical protein